MLKFLRLSIFCLFICLVSITLSIPVMAMTQEETDAAKRAFSAIDDKQWAEALVQANNSNEKALQTLVKWQYMLDPDSGASFSEISQFIIAHPDWPEQKKLKIRAELSLPDSNIEADEIIKWFGSETPITGVGKIALATALNKNGKKNDEKIEFLVRSAWREGDFSESQELAIIAIYYNIIRREDDIARADRLLWEGKENSAQRIFIKFDDGHKKLYKARIALQDDKKNALKLVSQVPSSLKKDVGLVYDLIAYQFRHNGSDSVINSLLLSTPKKIPYPEKWWKYRESKIREALIDGNISLASRLLENNAQEEGQTAADANWLKGRLLLKYKNQPKEAYQVFTRMFSSVKYPVSKSRAAYWAAKAAQQSGDVQEAKNWFNKAISYPTTFYGQLAALINNGTAPLKIPSPPAIDSNIREEFNSRSTVRAANLCILFGDFALAGKLINNLVADSDSDSETLLASELGVKAGRVSLSVKAAKKAMQANIALIDTGYPTPSTPENILLPRNLALAITRQESEFDNMAKSPSGALGMMQLLPSTAREVARKNDIGYDAQKLYDPEYNMQLGSIYLQKLIDNYDGSVIMGIAAYNGGPGNVYKWVQKFGRPEGNIESAVDWIENIPFSETRNYVQRVLENLQVYRYIESQKQEDGNSTSKLLLGQDLVP